MTELYPGFGPQEGRAIKDLIEAPIWSNASAVVGGTSLVPTALKQTVSRVTGSGYVSLPNAVGGKVMLVQNASGGNVTVVPAIGTVDGGASVVMADGDIALFVTAANRAWVKCGFGGGGAGGDFVKISSGTISSPVPHFDVALTGAYSSYQLKLGGLLTDQVSQDILYATLSFDGGVTYLADAVNNDSYRIIRPSGLTDLFDKFLYLTSTNTTHDTIPGGAILDILPGSASSVAQVFTNVGLVCAQNLEATVPPTLARATNIKILPNYGGDNFVAGYWALYGVN